MLCKALPGTGVAKTLASRSHFAFVNTTRRSRNSKLTVRAFTFDSSNPSTSPADIAESAYPALQAVSGVSLVSSQQNVTITDLWQPNQPCVLALGRSMG
jgi:hypothetical protein